MRRIVLALVLLSVALPTAAQTMLGVRAGVGIARMDLQDGLVFTPCLPDMVCLGSAINPAHGVTFGADLAVPLGVDPLEIRVGGTYAVKGGVRSGRDANGEPLSPRASAHYVQLSPLLGARLRGARLGRLSATVLAGPWVALRLWCREDGTRYTSCGRSPGSPDFGIAVGGGVEAALSSRLSLGAEAIYHHGLLFASYEATRFVAIQAGVIVPVG